MYMCVCVRVCERERVNNSSCLFILFVYTKYEWSLFHLYWLSSVCRSSHLSSDNAPVDDAACRSVADDMTLSAYRATQYDSIQVYGVYRQSANVDRRIMGRHGTVCLSLARSPRVTRVAIGLYDDPCPTHTRRDDACLWLGAYKLL